MWCWAVEGPLAVLPVALEFLTFASTQKVISEPYPLLQHSLIERRARCSLAFRSELEAPSLGLQPIAQACKLKAQNLESSYWC